MKKWLGCILSPFIAAIVLWLIWVVLFTEPHRPAKAFSDYGSDVEVDGSGGVYVMGTFWGKVDFDPGRGRQVKTSSREAAFLSRFNAEGEFEWVRAWREERTSSADEAAVDPDGHIYLVSAYCGWNDPVDSDATSEVVIPIESLGSYISKFGPDGTLEWAHDLPFSFSNYPKRIARSSSGSVYVGTTFEETQFSPPEYRNYKSNGRLDACLVCFSPDGTLQWVKVWGGPKDDGVVDICVDANDNIWVISRVEGEFVFNQGESNQRTISAGEEWTLFAEFDADGELLLTIPWGEPDNSCRLTSDLSGNVYLTGLRKHGSDFDFGGGPVKGETDIEPDWPLYLSKLDSSANTVWTYVWEWSNYDGTYDLSVDRSGNVYLVGLGRDFPGRRLAPGVGRSSWEDPRRAFVSAIDPNGEVLWNETWPADDYKNGIYNFGDFALTTDSMGNVYVTGGFVGTVDFDPGEGVDNHRSHAHADAFLMKLDHSGQFKWAKTWGSGEPIWFTLLYLGKRPL